MRIRVVLSLALVGYLLAPVPAFAHVGWWDFLDALSGPGPFGNGVVFDLRVACKSAAADNDEQASADILGGKSKWEPFWRPMVQTREGDKVVSRRRLDCLPTAKAYLELRGGRATSESQPLFSDRPGELTGTVAVNTAQAMFMRQLDPALAVGVGAGWIWFSGDQVEGHPGFLSFVPVSVAFAPLKLFLPATRSIAAGFITIRFEEIAIIPVNGGLSAKDFNSRSTSPFKLKSDLVPSVSVSFDLLAPFR